jgi:hypothetical protein
MTGSRRYVACLQELILRGPLHLINDDGTWASLVDLAKDKVTDVRIGVARLVGLACREFLFLLSEVTTTFFDYIYRASHIVP